jgi:hypothetical protein
VYGWLRQKIVIAVYCAENWMGAVDLIGPHEGRELSLMLAGEKPLAFFFEVAGETGIIPDDTFAPYVASGEILRFERVFEPSPGLPEMPSVRVVFFCQPGEGWRVDAAVKIVEPVFSQGTSPTDRDDAELGRLLGYSEEDIDDFNKKAKH